MFFDFDFGPILADFVVTWSVILPIIANLTLQLSVRSADVEFPKVNKVLFKSKSNNSKKK